jgi:5-methylcytosine-specific restriction endonuclease McrA
LRKTTTSTYLGQLCNRGHEYEKTGKSLRYSSNWDCVQCTREREDKDKTRVRVRLWGRGRGRTQDIESKRESARKYQHTHPIQASLNQQTRRARKRTNGVYPVSAKQVKNLYASFRGLCAWCMEREATELDHVVSIKQGGVHGLQNLLPACRSCNRNKADKEPWSWYQRQEFYTSEWERVLRQKLAFGEIVDLNSEGE